MLCPQSFAIDNAVRGGYNRVTDFEKEVFTMDTTALAELLFPNVTTTPEEL